MARIIVAEDDRKQAALLRAYLERDGHAVVVAEDGRRTLDEVRRRRPDLVLLDVLMPGLDGRDVLRALRHEDDVPVILVTALSTEDDELLGFDLGADDYVTKPYRPRQLVARVRAVLRRSGAGRTEQVIRVGDLEVDTGRCEVRVGGRPVDVTARELALLEALGEQPGRVLDRRRLLEAIAGFDSDVLERTVDTHVLNLRRKIEPDPRRPQYVLTVPGRGYKLADRPGPC